MAWVHSVYDVRWCHVSMERIKGKARPRFDWDSKHAYTDRGTKEAEQHIRSSWARQHGMMGRDWIGAVEVEIVYKREVAKTATKKSVGKFHLKKPDNDNVGKLVLDALNGCAWHDDVQVNKYSVERALQGEPGSDAWVDVTVTYYNEREVIPRENH